MELDKSRGCPAAGQAGPELASPARRLVPSGWTGPWRVIQHASKQAVWFLCTCLCARALLGTWSHSSEPALDFFLLQGTTCAPPRLIGALQE